MSIKIALLFPFLLSGCQLSSSPDDIEFPLELQDLRSQAFRCMMDVRFTALENSEHCVLVAEQYFDTYRDECYQSDADGCVRHREAMGDIQDLYTAAVIESLMRYGMSQGLNEMMGKEPVPHLVFFRGEWMRKLFDACLERERNGLAESGLIQVSQVPMIPLKKGQQCFRSGYPEFDTRSLEAS